MPSERIESNNKINQGYFQQNRKIKLKIVEAMLSKFILMMPKTQLKNQESSKYHESKSCSIKNQDSSKESREDSRYARTIKISI